MRVKRIDHVAFCSPDVDAALPPWMKVLGLTAGHREQVAAQKTEAMFAHTQEHEGAKIELIAPMAGNEGLVKFNEKNGGRSTLHHVAFVVDDLAAALKELDAAGVPLIDKVPRPGLAGHMVAFLHPKATNGVLVELVAEHKGH
jgi:methylmalonyl-CoA/ethylmalonyl-CoA epimerase